MKSWTFLHCPEAPDWTVDWERICREYAWVEAMAGVPQDPVHHAEGDVQVHTEMVVKALAELPEWRRLKREERAMLFAAALLHDVAKPACTRTEPDGSLSSRGHARLGAAMARNHLSDIGQTIFAPLFVRETIVSMVRLHGLPLWFLERPDPERIVAAASQRVRLDWVALLAEADVRGRICQDQEELLTRVKLFREYCKELGCETGPRRFGNEHSRFRYFRGLQRDPAYTAYDDTAFEVVLMAGLPGVGKDTWIRRHLSDWPVISLDQIRRRRNISPSGPQGEVVHRAKEQARTLLRQKRSFVWNATNITRMTREGLIDLFASYGARIRIVYLDAPIETILRRNRERKERVPEDVIHRLRNKLEIPDLTEAHHVEWIDGEGNENRLKNLV
ncbi:AAA family ATPase [Desmospora profundinema]|uniref:Nucleotidyltransferase with HDIG domain n=1 Tax=Desmospora profundinema TaxID=1571184 RepID=A0ABU1IPR6_9BACL|nr:AAA family ATPase [Desmospora profundinema]MDR6226781.1 putative nucleotidyltransferase with HDIG domain [Desmospora profundinema]